MKKIMKLMSLFFLIAATQYSCINDADVETPVNPIPDSSGNLALVFEIPNDSKTRSTESSGTVDKGAVSEYKVHNLTLYLFDSFTKVFIESYNLSDFSFVDNSDATVQYARKSVKVKPGKYNIFAIANSKDVSGKFTTQSQFLGLIDKDTYKEGLIPAVPGANSGDTRKGFVMTNRGSANQNVTIEDSKTPTEVTISLERAVAKVEVSQVAKEFVLSDSEGTYATITISLFRALNLPTQFYLFRHTAVLNSMQDKPASYSDINFGNVNNTNGYVIDPYFFNKTVEGASDEGFNKRDGFYMNALVDMEPNDSQNNWSPIGDNNFFYCLENCMFKEAQLNAYTTGLMFKANINIEPTRVFDATGNVANDPWSQNLFYVAHNFYTSIDAIRQKNPDYDIPQEAQDSWSVEELAKYHITKIIKNVNYSCYYNYWIKHNTKSEINMDVMKYGIVRNNIYKVSITSVKDLGTGEPDKKPINPDDNKGQLDTKVEVFPWGVRDQNADLE